MALGPRCGLVYRSRRGPSAVPAHAARLNHQAARKQPKRMATASPLLGGPTAPGKIILLNGASSSGKSTLAAALQLMLDEPFWHYSIDHLLAAKVLPTERIDEGHFSWRDLRPRFFAGFHATLPVLAEAGNNLVVEHIIETAEWMDRLARLLHAHDVYFVGLHCPLEELERRESARGDRRVGEARGDFETTHRFCSYDLEVSSSRPVQRVAQEVVAGWKSRSAPSAFARAARHACPP